MPIVDYRCGECGVTREVNAPSPVADTLACPSCGGAARRQYGLGGLLGVRPARRAKERLDRERATKEPLDATARQRLHDHQHGHDHDHPHNHDHDHAHDHPHDHPHVTKEGEK
jgi:putative FmdB family regulatory protein